MPDPEPELRPNTPAKATAPRRPVLDESSPSLSALLEQLTADGRDLVRQEIELAKGEVKENARALIGGGASLAAGAAILLLGALVLVVALILGLRVLLDGAYWLSALIVGGATILAGIAIALGGSRRLRRTGLTPSDTIDSLQESSKWLRTELTTLGRRDS